MSRNGYWAYIQPAGGGGGRPDQGFDPNYPDQGLPGGGGEGIWGPSPGHPDQGLPPNWGGWPGHPDQGLPGGGRPIDPGFGHGRPPQAGHLPSRPGGRPVDPGYGVGEGSPGHLPVWPVGPDQGLPPIPGQPLPPTDPPPGTIWPPLPPGAAPSGKALVLALIQGVGYRYIVIEISPPHPDQGLPGGSEHPDQGLPPGQPGSPDQGLPPQPGQPGRPDNSLPPQRTPRR
jgi:hypothetical protein